MTRKNRPLKTDSHGYRWIGRKTNVIVAGAAIALTLIALIAYRSAQKRDDASQKIKQANQVLDHLDAVHTSSRQMDASGHALVLTKDSRYLQSFRNGVSGVEDRLRDLNSLFTERPVQGERLNQLARLHRERRDVHEKSIRGVLPLLKNAEDGSVPMGGAVLLDQIGNLIASMKQTEQELLRQHELDEQRSLRRERIMLWFGALIGMLLAFLSRKVILQDLGDRHRVEEQNRLAVQRLAAQYDIAKILAEGEDFDETSRRLLEAVSKTLQWEVCELWVPDARTGRLHLKSIHDDDLEDGHAFGEASREISFAPGEGLPGRVWVSGEAIWVANLSKERNFVRASLAAASGLRSGLAFPILMGAAPLGVIMCFSVEPREREDQFLNATATIGRQFGQFFHRTRVEELFSKAFHVNPAPMSIVRVADRKIVEVNDSFIRLSGVAKEGIVERTLVEIGIVTDLVQREDYYKEILAGGSLYDWEVKMYFQGEKKVMLVCAGLITLNDELCILWSHQDITGRKHAEERFSKAFHNNPVPMMILRLNDRKSIAVNESFLSLSGYQRGDLLNGARLDAGHGFDVEDRKEFFQRLTTTGAVNDFEASLTFKSGRFDTIISAGQVVLDGEDCALISIQDITARKQAEEALRRSEERNRYLIENADDIIYQTDDRGQFTFVNPAGLRVIKYAQEEIVGRHFTELILPEYRGAARAFYARQFLERIPNTYYEFAVETKDGRNLWVGQNVQLVLDEKGIRGFQAVARDISVHREIEEQLKRARDMALTTARLKSEFLANMSHEIRTPMYGVTGMVDLLMDTDLDDVQRSYVESIRFSGDQLLSVINDILDFSKIEAGKLSFETIDFDFYKVVERTIDLFAERAALKQIEIGSLIEPKTPKFFRGDPARLQQIFSNLVGNAVKFTEQGEILVEVRLEEEREDDVLLHISVSDTGIGIAEEGRRILFQPFSQSDGSMTRKYGGTGLGLAITSQLVEMMGGQIGVESALGEGSTFWFKIRLRKHVGAAPESPARDQDFSKLRALIVDDTPLNRKILTAQTGAWGMQTEQAENGAQALQRLREAAAVGRPFDLALLDYSMPDMDGIQTAFAIRAEARFDDLKLVLLSSNFQRPPDSVLKRAGIAAALTKPIRQSDLFEQIARVLDQGSSISTRRTLPATASSRKAQQREGRILIVDDNPPNRIVAMRQVESLGYCADVADSGKAAIEAIGRTRYAVVLMDCQMPVMDGFATTAAIRARQDDERNLCIIALTANALHGEREHCLDMGMNDYLTKPIDREALEAALTRWIPQNPQTSAASPSAPLWNAPVGYASIDVSKLNEVRELQLDGDPDIVTELIVAFLETTTPRMPLLLNAIMQGNDDEVHFLTHTLRGSAGLVGAARMANLAKDLESQYGTGSLSQSESLWRELTEEYSRVRVALESQREVKSSRVGGS